MGKSGHLEPSARARGYTPEWDRASKDFLAANPWCLCCRAVGKSTRSSVTDHVIPHRRNLAVFWDRTKWQPACSHCHNVIKQMLEKMLDARTAGPDDMWLTSALAVSLRRRHRPKPQTGLDGWPVN